MYKLTVIAGPNRGTSYPLSEGETTVGRQSGNVIVLPSSKVSKNHCVLNADSSAVVVQDRGSSNGTFVNGILSKVKRLVPGDRLSVGDFVLELSRVSSPAQLPMPPSQGVVIQFPTRAVPRPMPFNNGALPGAPSGTGTGVAASAAPKTPIEKARAFLETKIMPIFYGIALKNEWRVVAIGVFAAFAIVNLVVAVFPILQANRTAIVAETQRRAQFMARQMAERNAPILAAGAETKTDTAGAETGDGVRAAVLTDLELRILAPAKLMNQYFVSGSEAVFAKKVSSLFKEGRERGVVADIGNDVVVAVEPVRVYIASTARNTVTGMAIVSVDASIAIPSLGDMGLVYGETLILTALIGALLFYILYRVTLKPLEVLNEDMDKALKGELAQVTHEFKWEELNSLWEIIQSTVQRATRESGGGEGGSMAAEIGAEEIAAPFRLLGAHSKIGVVVCDANRAVVSLNAIFEEASGIRADGAIGQELSSLARDQAFGSLVQDLFARAQPGSDGVSEDFDFSGVTFKLHASAVGAMTGTVKAYVLLAIKAEGSG